MWRFIVNTVQRRDHDTFFVDGGAAIGGLAIDGFNGKLMEVPLAWLFVDSYQRPPREDLIEKIANNFDDRVVGTLLGSFRGPGRIAVLDGQQRFRGMSIRFRGQEHDIGVPVRVLFGLTYDQEAEIYERFNRDRSNMKPADLFWSQYLRGDQGALDILATVRNCGYDLVRGKTGRTGGNIIAIGSLIKIYTSGGISELRETLEACVAIQGTDEGPINYLMDGVHSFIRHYRGLYDPARLSDVMSRESATKLLADGTFEGRRKHRGTPEGVARVILDMYNNRTRSGRLPSWESRTDEARKENLSRHYQRRREQVG